MPHPRPFYSQSVMGRHLGHVTTVNQTIDSDHMQRHSPQHENLNMRKGKGKNDEDDCLDDFLHKCRLVTCAGEVTP